MEIINRLLLFWVNTEWYVALVMSMSANVMIFFLTATVVEQLVAYALKRHQWGQYLDERPLKPHQRQWEMRYGFSACAILALCSLVSRENFTSIWPTSTLHFVIQIVLFSLFYETYSYGIHRLLHLRFFSRVHGVHHRSVRVTPWSAYSVHPIEALLIGSSAPLFMMVFPTSLGVVLALHIIGMIFTIILHSNFALKTSVTVLNAVAHYPPYHTLHHQVGNVNYGFTHTLLDKWFKTTRQR